MTKTQKNLPIDEINRQLVDWCRAKLADDSRFETINAAAYARETGSKDFATVYVHAQNQCEQGIAPTVEEAYAKAKEKMIAKLDNPVPLCAGCGRPHA